MRLRRLALALLVCLGCVALAGIPAAAGAHAGHPKRNPAKIQVESIQVGSKVGPLVLRVRGNGETRLNLAVDGHKVPGAFEWDGRHTQIAEPRAELLRPGANKLRISGSGKAAVTRTVTVPRRLLQIEAGADLGIEVDSQSTVGAAPAATGATPGIDYDWTVVKHPQGGNADLTEVDAAQPMLDPSAPGTYVLQEEADPEGPAAPTYDQVVVSVARAAKPIGVPINTLDNETGAIKIGNEVLGGGRQLSYAVLERSTGATVASGTVGNDPAGVGQLRQIANARASGDRFRFLMIVSGLYAPPEGALGDFNQLLMSLGGKLLTPVQFEYLKRGSAFSVIGIPGAAKGAATVRIAPNPQASGAMVGYLEQNSAVKFNNANAWEFVSPDHPSFDTSTPESTATKNVMRVGDQEISADLPPGTTAGLQVVVLEPLTLRLLDNAMLATNGQGNADQVRQDAAAGLLERLVNRREPEGPLVMVQTVGKPAAAGPVWTRIANTLARLGANRLYVNALDGTSEYAIVNRVGAEAPPAEASTARDTGFRSPEFIPPARLVGSLSRGREDAFEPTVTSSPFKRENPDGLVNLELMGLAYQPTKDWPPFPGDAAEAKKAEEFICSKVEGCGSRANQCPTVRECFWQQFEGADWTDVKNDIRAAEASGPGFTAATLKGVKDVLSEEAGEVGAVKRYVTRLREPLEKSETKAYVNLKAIGKQVYDSLKQPAVDNTKAWVLGLIGKVVAVGGFFGPPVSAAASGLSATFGLASFLSTETGQPILSTEIDVKSADLEQDISNRIDLAKATTRQLGLLLVSDPAKLATAVEQINSDWKLPDGTAGVEKQLTAGAKQWFYEALVPAGYPYLIRGNAYNARQLNCRPGSPQTDWPNQPDVNQVQVTTGWDASGHPIRGIYWFASGYGGGSSPPASLGESLFKPEDEGGVGLQKLAFFTPAVFGQIYHARSGFDHCAVGFLPRK